ncbi:hypothetical protein BDQ12DRAFT_661221 [Crucibulum laeve]|uniref:Uncharacterized protein n=1 Tax=Crucibulum laeve TaxID=68775 RepID=A0A5C3MGC0_9AGAR|nr:hypothetical protein BDQ12DRAFT_661221 [Crucibulum laeve]
MNAAGIADDRDLPPLPIPPRTLNDITPNQHAFHEHPSNEHPSNETQNLSRSQSERRSSSHISRDSERSLRELGKLRLHDEVKELKRMVHQLTMHLQAERRRADDAERRAKDTIAYLKSINDARLVALQDAARANAGLQLYKIQLEAAQHEIHRAQDAIDAVDRQRHHAENEAAKVRSALRKAHEDNTIRLAREEGRQVGIEEGLSQGRDIGYEEGRILGYEEARSTVGGSLEEDREFEQTSIGITSFAHGPDTASVRPRSIATSNNHRYTPTPPRSVRSPDPVPIPAREPNMVPPIHQEQHEGIHPALIRNGTPQMRPPSAIPPDNFIPTSDPNNGGLHLPPPHGFNHPPILPERTPSPTLSAIPEGQENSFVHNSPQPSQRAVLSPIPPSIRLSPFPSASESAYPILDDIPENPTAQTSSRPNEHPQHEQLQSRSTYRPDAYGRPSSTYTQGGQIRPSSQASHRRERESGDYNFSIQPPSRTNSHTTTQGSGAIYGQSNHSEDSDYNTTAFSSFPGVTHLPPQTIQVVYTNNPNNTSSAMPGAYGESAYATGSPYDSGPAVIPSASLREADYSDVDSLASGLDSDPLMTPPLERQQRLEQHQAQKEAGRRAASNWLNFATEAQRSANLSTGTSNQAFSGRNPTR